MVYDTQITIFRWVYKPTNITGGAEPVEFFGIPGIPRPSRYQKWSKYPLQTDSRNGSFQQRGTNMEKSPNHLMPSPTRHHWPPHLPSRKAWHSPLVASVCPSRSSTHGVEHLGNFDPKSNDKSSPIFISNIDLTLTELYAAIISIYIYIYNQICVEQCWLYILIRVTYVYMYIYIYI